MKVSAVSAFFATLLLVSTHAIAGQFVADYAQWGQLNADQRALYATGLYDGLILGRTNDLADQAFADGMNKCAVAIRLDSGFLSEAITTYYLANPKAAGEPPAKALMENIVRRPCLSFINKALVDQGLAPWPKP